MATEKRLIDANEVKKVFDNLRNETFALEDPKTAGVIAGTVITCGILIDEIPTVDAVEVVHGRWLTLEEYAEKISADPTGYAGGWQFCSECEQPMRELYGWAYCPNCGAKMDGDGDGT